MQLEQTRIGLINKRVLFSSFLISGKSGQAESHYHVNTKTTEDTGSPGSLGAAVE